MQKNIVAHSCTSSIATTLSTVLQDAAPCFEYAFRMSKG